LNPHPRRKYSQRQPAANADQEEHHAMTIRSRAPLLALLGLLAAGPASAQQGAEVTITGR